MSERLEQLLVEARQHEAHTQKGQFVLIQLVEEILRSRTICRPLLGQPLSPVQTEIYGQVKAHLLSELSQKIDSYNLTQIPVRTWVSELRQQAFKKILDDQILKQLAREIQHLSPTQFRRHLLGELVEAILLSGRLSRPHREKFSSQFYKLIYEEAVVKTLAYVCKNINQYDPNRGQNQKFMNWVNFRLDRLVIESRREFSEPMAQNLHSLAQLENLPQPSSDFLLEQTKEYMENDPAHIFQQHHIRDRPDANFRAIALARFSGKSWEEISQDLGIKIPTLSCFFQKACSKFRGNFQENLDL
ncbi:MAG TPA: hypothetical protein DDZ80_11270 [Cyanobacteria bacterium UBA8803]|nr:hypothetical protein [Cyanobacteria bacterium UBA9273]HBL59071.1 hypothetical protein [Cyanobacteria bacterium UBA8803]